MVEWRRVWVLERKCETPWEHTRTLGHAWSPGLCSVPLWLQKLAKACQRPLVLLSCEGRLGCPLLRWSGELGLWHLAFGFAFLVEGVVSTTSL